MLNVTNPALESDLQILRTNEARASQSWRTRAVAVVRALARTNNEFTVDTVRVELEKLNDLPRNSAALGKLMLDAQERKYIEHANRYVPSSRPDAHRRVLAVWLSKIQVVS